MAERAIAIKLTVRDQETVVAALRAVGKSGEDAANKLEAAWKKAAAGQTEFGRTVTTAKAALGELKGPVGELTGNFLGLGGIMGGLALGLGGVAAAVGVLASGFVAAANRAKEFGEWAEATTKFAKRLGSSVEELQALDVAARKFNVSSDALKEGLKGLEQRAFEASIGIGKARQIWDQLGISVRDAAGNVKPTLDLLKELADVLKQYDRADQRVILNRLGMADLAPLLKEGSEGLKRFFAEAEAGGEIVRSGPLAEMAKLNAEIRAAEVDHAAKLNARFAEFAPDIQKGRLQMVAFKGAIAEAVDEGTRLFYKLVNISAWYLRATGNPAATMFEERKPPDKPVPSWWDTMTDEEPTRHLRDKTGDAAAAAALKRSQKLADDRIKIEREAELAIALDKRGRLEIEAQHELEQQEELLAKKEINVGEYNEAVAFIEEKRVNKIAQFEREEQQKTTDRIVEQQKRAAERAAEAALKPWERFGDDLERLLSNALDNGFKIDSASISRSINSLGFGILNQQTLNPLLAGFGLAKPLAGSENSPLFKLGSQLAGGATLFGQPLFTQSEADVQNRAAEGNLFATAGPGLLQNTLGGAAQGSSLGSLVGMIPGLNAQNSQIGGAIGGGLGAAIGTAIFPGIGTVIGGLLGSVAGGLLGGLFGPKKPSVGPGANALFNQTPEGRPQIAGYGADNGGSVANARTFAEGFQKAINNMMDTLDLGPGRFGGLTAGVNTGGFGVGLGAGFGNIATGSNAEEVIQQALFAMLKRGDTFFELSDMQKQVGAKSTATDLEGLLSDFEFAKNLKDAVEGFQAAGNELKTLEIAARKAAQAQVDAITGFVDKAMELGFATEALTGRDSLVNQLLNFTAKPEALSETAKAVAALGVNFKVLRENAEALGVTEARIAEAEADAKAELARGFDAGIAQQILAIVDPLAASLKAFDDAAQMRVEEARLAGADLVQVERLNALERQKVLEQAGQSSLEKFYEELTFGAISGASPVASLEGTRASFMAAAAQGDRGRIEELGRSLLTQSRGAYASGTGFQSDLDYVRNVVGDLAGPQNAVVAAINASGGENIRYQAQIVARLGDLANENAGMRDQIAQLNSLLQRLLPRAA